MRALLKALAVALLLGLPLGQVAAADAPFAALTVVPNGRQVFDIITGLTSLPDGGSVTDQQTGVTLEAARIEFMAQEYVAAWDVSLTGEFGRVQADSLRIDLAAGVLTASGGLGLEREGLSVTATSLTYDANAGVAVFDGPVASTSPAFEADRALLDVTTGDVLLSGEYVFQDGLFAMRSPEGGGMLGLKVVLHDGVATYDAATEVAPEVLARFGAYL